MKTAALGKCLTVDGEEIEKSIVGRRYDMKESFLKVVSTMSCLKSMTYKALLLK